MIQDHMITGGRQMLADEYGYPVVRQSNGDDGVLIVGSNRLSRSDVEQLVSALALWLETGRLFSDHTEATS